MKKKVTLVGLRVKEEMKKCKGSGKNGRFTISDLCPIIKYDNEKTISPFLNGHPISRDRAEKLADYFGVSIDYLTGKTQYRTRREENEAVLNKTVLTVNEERQILDDCLFSLAKLAGYEIVEDINDNIKPNDAISVVDTVFTLKYCFKKDGESIDFSFSEILGFENEICDYVEMRLDRMIKNKKSCLDR
jgi:transcriptional regulator with XRE-family HTH domain